MTLYDKTHALGDFEILSRLALLLDERAKEAPEVSYTARLLEAGVARCAKKLGEEGVELALAAVLGDQKEISAEAADVLYHFFVLLKASGTPISSVFEVLESRMGTSGLVEKARRGDG